MATNGREEESTAAAADAAIWRQRLLKCWNFVLVNKFLFLSLLGVAGGENPNRLNSYIWWANGAIAGWERFENLIDRCNTVVNVFSDCIGVSIIYEVSKKELEGHRQEMIQMDFSNAADVAPDQIQVHFSDRESENESLHTPPENPFSEFSDAAEQLDPNPSS